METNKLPAAAINPFELQELSRQIEQWRSTRPHRMPMPDPLWRLAANLARQYGVAWVARRLRLDYYSLKDRIQAPEPHEAGSAPGSGPSFIELPRLTAAPVSECIIELEHSRGSRIRIQVKGAAMGDVTELSRALWSMKG